MHRLATAAVVLALGAAPLCSQEPPAGAPAAAEQPANKFIRFVDLGDFRGRLEVAIARFADRERGIEVDLVSAVHVGETSYYGELSRRFAGYDAVLYELVAPEGTRPDARAAKDRVNPVSMLQQGMKRMLDLDFQLEAVDYDAENFVHADLSPRDLSRKWKERGESLTSALLKMMLNAAKVQQERYEAAAEAREEAGDQAGSEAALPRGRENKRRALKWALAKELGPMEEMLAMFGGDDKGSDGVLIGERNKKAVEVLQREIAAGKKKLAIFYGAAHMPDMADRVAALGLVRVGQEWIVAWDVGSAAAAEAKKAEAKK